MFTICWGNGLGLWLGYGKAHLDMEIIELHLQYYQKGNGIGDTVRLLNPCFKVQ